MDTVTVGLDIGCSAVRAAELALGRDQPTLTRYAQVGLPHGAVVDGEIVNGPAVSEALRRLWAEGGFSTNKVVLGVSGHRVIIRQADVPALDEEDLRSALKFDTQELIPIPMEEACVDFSVLERDDRIDADGKHTMRILILAAHRELLRTHLAALAGAGLEAVAVDAAPLALLRVVPAQPGPEGGGACEALVSIGAELTTVAVRQGGSPRFIRSLTIGGGRLTAGIANALHVDTAVAERLKRGDLPAGSTQLAQARKAATPQLRDLAEEVRGTVDFFVVQGDDAAIDRVLLTGGASQTEGLMEAIGSGLKAEIYRIDPFATVAVGDLGLDPAQLRQAQAGAATALGLALWPLESPSTRLSVLPEEVKAARHARRVMSLAGLGVAALATVLVLAGIGRVVQVHHAESQVHAAQHQVAAMQGTVGHLEAITAVHAKVASRSQLVVTALAGDIDWVRVLGQLAQVMPPGLSLTSLTATRSVPAATPAAAGTAPAVGTLTFNVTGAGGLQAVSAWLHGLQSDGDLQGTWVSGIVLTSSGGKVTFGSTSNLTKAADSSRAQGVSR